MIEIFMNEKFKYNKIFGLWKRKITNLNLVDGKICSHFEMNSNLRGWKFDTHSYLKYYSISISLSSLSFIHSNTDHAIRHLVFYLYPPHQHPHSPTLAQIQTNSPFHPCSFIYELHCRSLYTDSRAFWVSLCAHNIVAQHK